MRFQYTTLAPNSIRVLRFSHHATDSFIHAWLEHLPNYTTNSSRYSVIVYQPDAEEQAEQKSITVNGRSFVVPPQLYEALRSIIKTQHIDTFYWADAISINHGDPEEVSAQQSQMGQIYACAKNVLVWLGEKDEQIEALLMTLQRQGKAGSSQEACSDDNGQQDLSTGIETAVIDGLVERVERLTALPDAGVSQLKNVILSLGRFRMGLEVLKRYSKAMRDAGQADPTAEKSTL